MEPIILYGRAFNTQPSKNAQEVNTINTNKEQIRDIAQKACISQNYPWTADVMLKAQEADPQVSALKRLLTKKKGEPGDDTWLLNLPIDQFCVSSDGLVYRVSISTPKGTQKQLFVPESIQDMALQYCHHYLGLHPGVTKTRYMM